MALESQLKAKMMAAIAKKKQETQQASSTSSAKSTHHTAISPSPTTPEPPPPPMIQRQKNDLGAVFSEVEWTKYYYGNPIKVAVYQKQIYYAVPDIIAIAKYPEEIINFDQFTADDAVKKTIAAHSRYIIFPNPNGGSTPLPAATTDNLLTLLHQFDFPQTDNLEKWLTDTTAALKIIVG